MWNDLITNSANFFYSFPCQDNRIENIAGNDVEKQNKIQEQARNVRVLCSNNTKNLINDFIEIKKKFGSKIEQQFYQEKTFENMIERFMAKRPLVFYTRSDVSISRTGLGVVGGYEKIGKDEQDNLTLEEYMSYDEIQISALLGVSCPTFFINNGNRNNFGKAAARETFQEEGTYVGLVGARFENKEQMESQHILVTPLQNTGSNGYGLNPQQNEDNQEKIEKLKIYQKFYDVEYFPTFEEIKQNFDEKKYFKRMEDMYINIEVYKKRIKIPFQNLLLEADYKAKSQGKKAYVFTVGLGLGVWQASKKQGEWIIEAIEEILAENTFEHIDTINFSWFPEEIQKLGNVENGKSFEENGNNIKIVFSKDNPADRISEDKILVASFAWDGNSFPGNEYWQGMLSASGDPAAASSSTIGQLMNPEINVGFWENVFVTK